MDEFPKVPIVAFGNLDGVLSKKEKKKSNRARFTRLYLGNLNIGHLTKSFLVSLPTTTLGTLLYIF